MPKSRKIGARIDIFKCPKRDFLSTQNENVSAQIDIFKCPKREELVPELIFLSAQIGNFWCPKREFKSSIVFFPFFLKPYTAISQIRLYEYMFQM